MDLSGAGALVGLIFRKRSLHNYDQAGPRMGVPPSVSPYWPRVLENINVGVASYPRDELPNPGVLTEQVERARRERAHRQDLSVKSAGGRCEGWRDRQHRGDERQCDKKQTTPQRRAVN